MKRTLPAVLVALTLLNACDQPEPRAGRLTEEDVHSIVPDGEVAGGRLGDYYLRNELATFIIQRPGRELSLGPYGGHLIDAALNGSEDQFGELIPTLALGRTIRVTRINVIRDGSDGGSAVLEAHGVDATNVYYNIEGLEPSLVSYDPLGAGILGHDPDETLGLAVRIRYELPADAARLSIIYTFENVGATRRLGVPLAFLIDSRGNVEGFLRGAGYFTSIDKSFDSDNVSQLLAYDTRTEQMIYTGAHGAYGIVPRRVGNKSPPRVIGATVPVVGGAILLETDSILGAAKEGSFYLEQNETIDVQIDFVLGASAAEVLEHGWGLLGVELADVNGCVALPNGDPVADVRVGLSDMDGNVVGTFETAADGCFAGRIPPGRYTAIAGRAYRPLSAEVEFDVPGAVDLVLDPLGAINIRVGVFNQLDATEQGEHPCMATVIGERTMVEHKAIGMQPDDDVGGVIYRQKALRSCAGSIDVIPGRYLVMVNRGPEFDRLEKIVDVSAGELANVTGAIHRVVDSSGYAASDFHIHAIYSPDSKVPAETRVLTMAVQGLDFWASTEHDVVADFTKHIAALGLQDELITMPGAEVTTFDTGHFGAYPLPVNPFRANGGTPDWAVREDGKRPSMADLFGTIHALGGLVQVNHPRSGGTALGAYFSRAGLVFDPITMQPYADPAQQLLDNSYLRYPAGLIYFSDAFDIIEVANGVSTYVKNGMVFDRSVERTGHDWMNMLSAGRRIVGVANSDTHSVKSLPGNPRTMVGGHDEGLYGLIGALERGDAILTTGPMVRVEAVDANQFGRVGIGDVAMPIGNELDLLVTVETADWYSVDRLEVIANVFFPDPTAGGEAPPAVPQIALTPQPVQRPNGGTAMVATANIHLDLSAAPFSGRDSWLMIRVGGSSSNMFPVMRGGGGALDTAADTPDAFLSNRSGQRAYAVTNPIFIDMDGDGVWRDAR